jgi:hypothetical protein
MARRCALLFVVLLGCGGRDPLNGPLIDDGTGAAPVTTPDAAPGGAGGAGGASGPRLDAAPPPVSPPDGPVFMPPPPPVRDAGIPRLDASPTNPPNVDCPLPTCLAGLLKECTQAGSCVQQRAMGRGGATNTCYANGVKFLGSTGNGGLTVQVTKPDGSACYTFQAILGGGGVNAFSYLAPNGQMVARVTLDRNLAAVTCTGEMTPQVVNLICLPGLMTGRGGGGGSAMCTQGMCN